MDSLAAPESSSRVDDFRPITASKSQLDALHDTGLVRRFNAGDAAALDEIISRHRGRVFSLAYSFLKNHSDAEEITQDTFIRAHRGLARFRGDCSLATWLHRISANLARNRYWYYFRRRQHVTHSIDLAVAGQDSALTFSDLLAGDAAGPVQEALKEELLDLIARGMERLSDVQREILILRNSLNYSYEDIARKLGISIGTVKSRIARSRTTLRALIADSCSEFSAEAGHESWLASARPFGHLQIASA